MTSRRLAGVVAVAFGVLLAGRATGQDFVPVPPLSGPVVDAANVMSEQARAAASNLAIELKQKTGAEIAVLTIPTTKPEDIFDYGMRVVENWKLGKGGRDDGLLLVVAVQDRRVHFLSGYGLEGILPDGRLGEIRDRYVLPAFRQGDVEGGIYAGLRAVADVIAADAGVQLAGQPVAPRRDRKRPVDVPGSVLLPLLLLFFLAPALGAGRGRRGAHFMPIFWGGGLGGSRGGGGFGGGGFGGGFGGGGSFGGGGAGGSW